MATSKTTTTQKLENALIEKVLLMAHLPNHNRP